MFQSLARRDNVGNEVMAVLVCTKFNEGKSSVCVELNLNSLRAINKDTKETKRRD
jgi:hypothetical protein